MAVSIGLPRGLLYHYYGDIWSRFFMKLGASVVVSSETTKVTLDQGDVLDEVCVPLKIYFGHVAELSTKVDYLFVPRVVSVAEHDYNCPKIIGLPDLLRSRLSNLPGIIDVMVSLRQDRYSAARAAVEAGRFTGANALQSLYAWYSACSSIPKASARSLGKSMRVALIGHPYIIKDRQASLGVFQKLTDMGLAVALPEDIPRRTIDQAAETLGKKLYWTYGHHLAGAALAFMNSNKPVDGIIFMTSFSCGPDSMISELIKQHAKKNNMPFLMLSIDEHTAEAGLLTRLEAFTDMLKRRAGIW